MINTWEIISSINPKTGTLNYTLLIDGTEHDARLIFKKLRGYAHAAQPATAPYVYSFALPSDMDEDTLRKIQTAVKEGVDQAKKVNEFVPGGILGNPLFNNEIGREDKDFPTFITLDPSESFFKHSANPDDNTPEVEAFEKQQINLDDAEDLQIESRAFSLEDDEPLPPSPAVAEPDDSEGERFLTSPDSLEEWPDAAEAQTLEVSPAVTAPPRMANVLPPQQVATPVTPELPDAVDFTPRVAPTPSDLPVTEDFTPKRPVPPPAKQPFPVDLPAPEDFTPKKPAPQPARAPEPVDLPMPEDFTPNKQPQPQVAAPAPQAAEELPISEKDMLIKDMEGTLLGQMPMEDIFSAETKYDMFLDLENEQLVKHSEMERAGKINNLADGKDSLEETVNSFEQDLTPRPQTAPELRDVADITDRIPRKQPLPAPAQPSPAITRPGAAVPVPPATQDIADPFEQLMAKSDNAAPQDKVIKPGKAFRPQQQPLQPAPRPTVKQPAPQPLEPEVVQPQEVAQDWADLTSESAQPGVMEKLDMPLPQKTQPRPEPKTEPKREEAQSVRLSNPGLQKPALKPETNGYSVEPAQPLDVDFNRPQTPRDQTPPAQQVPEEETLENSFRDSNDHTFNLETTIPETTMRKQYEKSFHTAKRPASDAANAAMPTLEGELEQTVRHKTFRIKARKPMGETDGIEKDRTVQMNKVENVMPENEGEKTNFRIRRIAAPAQPAAPGVPPPPPGPAAAAPAPQTPQAPKPAPAPVAAPKPTPANQTMLRNVTSANTLIEKTKTIDHSIELPLSELKKHNWPLEIPLIPTFTLENMVISVNRFAHATAISVIDNPGKLYNPLVLHGPSGTGKTHFLNAIGYALSKKYGQENIFITNGVRLSRGIQRYVMEGNIEKFQNFISSVKAILIDDIHLIAINEQNRAYISNLLNTFSKEQKQIVITSKYPPESLQKLEELIGFKLDSGWISELKPASEATHMRIVKKMLFDNGVNITELDMQRFFGGDNITLGTVSRSIRRVKVLEKLIFPNLPEEQRSESDVFEKLLATGGEDATSELNKHDFEEIKSIPVTGNGEWGRIGFFYPQNSSEMMNWLVFALSQRAKELGISGGLELAVRSSYSTENIISSAFKIANLCDNKKLKGAVILGPSVRTCEPSVRENFYDILTHMLEVMLIRCGIINYEDVKSPSTYVKILSELLR